jgi:hypothetical protein
MDDNPLPPVFSAAVEEFAAWSHRQLLMEVAATKITEPLYHYTDAAGLCGIVNSQRIWFTSYLHLNDPSEVIHGMDIVHQLLKAMGEGAHDSLVKMFCEVVDDVLQHQKFADIYGFYIASFSRDRNDLGWSRCKSPSAGCAPSRSRRNSSMRARIVVKSSAARARFTSAPPIALANRGSIGR